ncbi:peptidylprolyl isomerase [Paenibacillus thermoaerophilus]|uniref:Peptidyl-prolyl cis-trans isomerase n=1 Tax=Paenibacillus thermoaerophilus TaxID=1215385 RepID=A0ABW2V7T6_9BACL|nr:peptidylprolyl isomerase [Paenibacillus thermoaerophilus]TMV17116.1 peptidylprolyl isomerase [Paenibacillus thermoaerophilus]
MTRRSRRHRTWFAALTTAALAAALAACGDAKDNGAQPSAPASSPSPAASPAHSQAPATTKKQWSRPPEMQIDQSKTYEAVVETTKGSFTIALAADKAPQTVNSFVFLAKENYFENIKFHRIIKGFMVQTGDPKGDGTGGPGYKLKDELDPPPKYELGTVAMAKAGPNTAGSQFFICVSEDCGGLNGRPEYTVFGKVTEGMDNVLKIADTPVTFSDTGEPSKPKEDVLIQKVTIKEK